MFKNVVYNRHMFFRDKLYEYKQFCERIASSKSKYHSPPPKQFPFLKQREKKKQMEKERLDDIKYNQNLLITKLKTMYNKHNKYHPANMKFLSLPPSLKLQRSLRAT